MPKPLLQMDEESRAQLKDIPESGMSYYFVLGRFNNYSDPELHIIAGDFFIFPLTISVRTSNKQSSEKFETSQVEHPSYSDEMAVTCKDPCLYFHDIV